MTAFWVGFLVLLAWAACTCIVTIWSRKDHPGRTIAVILFALSVPILVVTFGSALGNHRPISWEQMQHYQKDLRYKVLAHKVIYEVGIYLYLDQDESPLAVVVPWDAGVAEQLQEAAGEAGEDGELEMFLPYQPSLDDNPPQFHALPQTMIMPPKEEPPPPVNYDRDA